MSELTKDFFAIPKSIRTKAFEVAEDAFPLMNEGRLEYIDSLKELQASYGGEIWNSGGNCMLLTMMHEPIEDTYYAITVSDEVVCITSADTQEDAFNPPDETYYRFTFYLM